MLESPANELMIVTCPAGAAALFFSEPLPSAVHNSASTSATGNRHLTCIGSLADAIRNGSQTRAQIMTQTPSLRRNQRILTWTYYCMDPLPEVSRGDRVETCAPDVRWTHPRDPRQVMSQFGPELTGGAGIGILSGGFSRPRFVR